MAVDLVHEGELIPSEALAQLEAYELERIGRRRLTDSAGAEPLASAITASTGVAVGALAFDSRRAVELAAQGQRVVLARTEIATEDVAGIAAADGVLAAAGGRTSHAAVVARQLGKVCLVGCSGLVIDASGHGCQIAGQRLREGELITLDGDTGRVYRGSLPVIHERPYRELAEIRRWRTDLAAVSPSPYCLHLTRMLPPTKAGIAYAVLSVSVNDACHNRRDCKQDQCHNHCQREMSCVCLHLRTPGSEVATIMPPRTGPLRDVNMQRCSTGRQVGQAPSTPGH